MTQRVFLRPIQAYFFEKLTMSFRNGFLLIVLVLIALPTWAAEDSAQKGYADTGTVITTPLGQVRGYIRNGVLEFRGIPYAEPMGKENRWTPAEPAKPWQGVLDAMHFKPACPQEARFNLTEESDKEDCLYLNVSLPIQHAQAQDQKRPVIVIIHGGALVGGSSSLYRLDRLATQADAVVVSFNYRLGVFGFLGHPGFDPAQNAFWGIQDQRLALRWVQKNIAAFGGNPDNVTILGESAGALSVCLHLSTPNESRGLFHKAIALSYTCIHPLQDVEQGNAFGLNVAATVGCDQPSSAIDCLRQLDTTQLVKAGGQQPISQPLPFTPLLGSPSLPVETSKAFQSGRFLRVPMILGGTRDELRLYVAYEIQAGKTFTPENYQNALQFFFGDHANEIAKAYPLSAFSSAGAALGTVVSDFMPGFGVNHCLSIETARLASKQAPVFFMDFADRTTPKRGILIPADPDPKIEIGAAHSSVMSYFFPGYSNTAAMSAPDLSPDSEKSAKLMLQYIRQFIRQGDPNGEARPTWMPFGSNHETLRFDEKGAHMINPAIEYQCDFWRERFPDVFKKISSQH